MSGKFVRASKYRHVFGQPTKKELCYENLRVTKNAWDSNIVQANGKYLALNWDSTGGGAFAIIPLNEVGKAPDQVSLFRGHKGPVLDTSFNPFNDQQIVSCSDDGKILLWDIPENYSFHKYLDSNDDIKDVTEPAKVLSGHTRKVGKVEFHPCAENVLASSSLDYSVKIWNLETGKDEITLQHKDLVTSFAFNYNGSLLATTSRDKKLRVWDVRSGKVISEGPGHTGAKASRVAWLGNTDRIVTTGFSRLSDRQVGLWNVNDIEKGPIDGFLVIDSSSGVLIPIFDDATNILYLAGKGDGNIRYYEYENDYLHDLSQYASTDPQRGFAAAPKRCVNVKDNEILKCFKTVDDHIIEPLSFVVPRRSELFQSDIFPDCPSDKPALSASEWFAGKECNGPLLMSMESLYEGTAPSISESKPAVKIDDVKKAAHKEAEASKEAKAAEKPAPVKVETPREPSPPKSVDDALKSSSEVNSLINKVNETSDIEEEEVASGVKDDEWEEVTKDDAKLVEETKEVASSTVTPVPTLKSEPVSRASTKDVKEDVKEPEAKKEPEPKIEQKKAEIETKPVEVKEAKSAASTPSEAKTSEQTKTTTGAPTLKATVERLSALVDRLETQVSSLTEANKEKNDKLTALESKLDELLKK